MSRSSANAPSSGALPLPFTLRRGRPFAPRSEERSSRLSGTALCLATMPPCDQRPENDVQSTKACNHEKCVPTVGGEERDATECHEREPHHRHRPYRVRTRCDDGGPIEHHPDARKETVE